jgi:hypothetical protein
MGVIKVETFDVDVTGTSGTHTLTTDVGSLNSAFVRRTTSIDKQSGLTNSTGNINPIDACSAAYLSATNTITFAQGGSGTQKLVGEVWRYTGASAGPDEFIVRGRYAITVTGTNASQAVSGIVNRDNCIPFFTGASNTANSTNDYGGATVSVYIDGSDNIQLERGIAIGTLVVYVTVVEFVGSNWSVGHGRSAAHDDVLETVTLNTSSTGQGGSSFDVGTWSSATIIEGSIEGDTSETGLSDNLGVWLTDTSTSVQFTHLQDGASRHDGVAYCHVLAHPSLTVSRDSNVDIAEGNGSYAGTATWPAGASTTESLDELALEWFSDTSGTGSAHARGRLSARIDSASSITFWVHRSGNNVRADWGVVQLGGITGVVSVVIDDVDTDNVLSNSQANVLITASAGGLEAAQGTGKVELVQFSGYSGTIINQSIDSWSDTSIQFDLTAGALVDSQAFVFVTTDDGRVGFISVQIGLPPETYKEAVEGMTIPPDHYWEFQDTYLDSIGAATISPQGGTPSFSAAVQLVKGDTHSFLIATESDHAGPSNQSDMNTSAIARRYVGGWFMLDRVSKTLSVIWEEGAQVNNMALLNGFGNNAVFQIANASDDYVQLYMDVSLTPDRPYHFIAKMHASGFDGGVCEGYLDGVLQGRTDGNPWETPQLDSHSGSITWGHDSGESLKVGDDRGVDATTIEFVSPVNCYYAHWYSWSDSTLDPVSDIRVTLFEKGAPAAVTIPSGTEAAMQAALDVYASTLRPDWPCAIEIAACSEGNFSLDFDSITFESRVSIQVRYVGAETLTIVANATTDPNPAKISAPYGGAVVINKPATLTLTGLGNPTEVRVFIAGTETEIAGQEDVTSGTFIASVQVASVDVSIISLAEQIFRLKAVDTSASVSLPIQQLLDRQYSND